MVDSIQENSNVPTKVPIPVGCFGPPSVTSFPSPTWVYSPNWLTCGSAVFAQLCHVTCYICRNRPHLYTECNWCDLNCMSTAWTAVILYILHRTPRVWQFYLFKNGTSMVPT